MSYPLITLPAGVTWNYKKTPKYQTIVQTPQSGRGQVRASLQQSPIYEWELIWNYLKVDGVSTANDFQYLHDFYEAMNGSFGAFIFDPSQYDLEQLSVGSNIALMNNGFSGAAPGNNYLEWSTDMTQSSAWVTTGVGASGPTYLGTSNPPSFTNGIFAQDFSFPAVPSTTGDYSVLAQTVTPGIALNGNSFTFSIWAYVTAAQTFTFYLIDNPETQGVSTQINLVAGWQQVSVTWSFSGTTSTQLQIGVKRLAGQAAVAFIGLYQPQLEIGSAIGPITQTYATNLPAQTAFQLWRSSAVLGGGLVTLLERIQNVSLLIGIYVNGSIVTGSTYTQSNFPATVTFNSPPAAGSTIVWAGNFNYLVHFAEDSLEFNEMMYQLWECGGCKLESVML
jgi:hypothetical protein